MWFKPRTTDICSDALADWAIRVWVTLALKPNLLQLLQLHLFLQCSRFISVVPFVSRCICVNRTLIPQVTTWVAEWIVTYGTQHWRILGSSYTKFAWVEFEQPPLNSAQTFQRTKQSHHEFNLHSEPTLYSYSNYISLVSVHVSFWSLPSSVATFVLS